MSLVRLNLFFALCYVVQGYTQAQEHAHEQHSGPPALPAMPTQSPSPKIERLQALLTTQLHDTTRFETLHRLSFLWSIHNLDSSLAYELQALRVAERIPDTMRTGRAALYLAGKYMHKGLYEKALLHAHQALHHFESIGKKGWMADAQKLVANILFLNGKSGEAFPWMMKAFAYYKEAGEVANQAAVYQEIASMYEKMESYTEAIEYVNKAASLFAQVHAQQSICECYIQLATLHDKCKQTALSAEYLTKVLDIARMLNTPHVTKIASEAAATLYMRQGQPKQAIPHYIKLLERANSDGSTADAAALYARLGMAYTADNKATQAVQSLRSGLAAARSVQARGAMCMCYRGLAQAFGAQQRFDSAYHYQKICSALSDSLNSEESTRTIAEMQARFSVQQKEQEIAVLQSKNQVQAASAERERVQRNALVIGVLALIALALLLVNRYRLKQRSAEALETKNAALTQANMEILQQQDQLAEQARTIQLANTRLQQTNLDLQRSNHELEESNHLRMQFLSIAAHDLKNPLTAMLGTATVFRSKLTAHAQPAEMLDAITEAAKQMYDLITDLLDTAAVQLGRIELKKQTLDMAELCGTLVQEYTPRAAAKQQTITYSQQGTCHVTGDERRLRQVVENLLSNAVKFSPFDAAVRVHLEQDAHGKAAILSVRDEGPGLTEEDQRRLFGFFQRLSARPTAGESSNGVGLSIVKHIVDLHGGRVEVESEYGEGTTFIVRLPLEG
jgi:signal transduction histidine kinase/tetratricopeptide (TPR) repeat protein